jgi:hypothetical protein
MSPPLRRSVDSPPLPTSHRQTRPSPGRGLMRAEHPAPGRGLMPTPVPAKCLRRLGCSSPSPSPPSPSSSSGGSHSSPSRDSRPTCCGSGHSPASLVACRSDASWHFHSAPPSARKDRPCARHLVACAPTRSEQVVQHQRVIRQRSQPWRTTCPPQRSSSSRLRAISSRPEPVR